MGKFLKLAVSFAVSLLEMGIAGRLNRADIEKAKALMKVADFHLARFNKSREIEQAANIFLWTVMLLAGVFLIEKLPAGSLPLFTYREFNYAFGTVLAGLHLAWLYRSRKSMNIDRHAYLKCRDRALEHIRSLEEIGTASAKELKVSGWADILMTGLTTLFLAWAVTFFVLARTDLSAPVAESKPAVIEEVVTASQFSPNHYLENISPLRLTPAEALLGTVLEE